MFLRFVRILARKEKIKLREILVVHFVLEKNHWVMGALHGIISDDAYILLTSSVRCMLFNGDE